MSANQTLRMSRSAFARMWNDDTVTTDQIAAAFGIHRSTVSTVGQRFGFPPRKMGSKRNPVPKGLLEMWVDGVRSEDIARTFGYSRNYLAKLAANHGLPGRRQGARYMTIAEYQQQRLARAMAASARVEQAALINAEMADFVAYNGGSRVVGAQHVKGAA